MDNRALRRLEDEVDMFNTYGPKGIRSMYKTSNVILPNSRIKLYEFPDNLTEFNEMEMKQLDRASKILWCEKMQRVAVELEFGSMYPLLATKSNRPAFNERNYSFYYRKPKSRPIFLNRTARLLGCDP